MTESQKYIDLMEILKQAENSDNEKADDRLALTDCSRSWRSAAFWHSDIEDIMDRIANEAMGYHPESRAEFFRDVMEAIKDHKQTNQ
jgi:hypothetical protein